MSENKLCVGCQWNGFPICNGRIGFNGEFERIDYLRPGFICGQKDRLEVDDLTPPKSTTTKLEELESRINILENATLEVVLPKDKL